MRLFRITKLKYEATAFSGYGAEQSGGRWNSPGTAVVYTSHSLATAVMEVLVHLEDWTILSTLYGYIPLDIDKRSIEVLDDASLPTDWPHDSTKTATQRIGDEWAASKRTLIFDVPSVVVPEERNLILNPLHPDFKELVPGNLKALHLDPRLIQRNP